MTAFLTCARGWQTLAATRSLGEKNIKVITADSVPFATSYFSRYSKKNFRYPTIDDEEKFISSLIENILKYRESPSDVLIPVFKETFIISKYLDRFKGVCKVPITDYKNLQIVHNKWKLYQLAQKLSVPVPKTFKPKTLNELTKILPQIKFPVMVKILDSAGGVGIKYTRNKEELVSNYMEIIGKYGQIPMIQEYIVGTDFCTTVLFNKGELRAKMTYRNTKQFPPKTGVGVLSRTVLEDEMEKMAIRICHALKWHGVAEFDFRKEKKTGKIYLIECNPRFWVSLNQSIRSLIDYPYLLYKIATEGDCPKQFHPKAGVETEFYLGNIATEIPDILNAKYKAAKWWYYVKHHFKVYKDVLSLSDPLPVLGVLYPLWILAKHGRLDVDRLLYS